jgi:MFS family permease
MFMVAVAVYAFHRSGAGGVGAVSAARLLPAMVAAPFAGHLVDRGNRARIVAISSALEAACLAAAAAFMMGGGALAPIVVLAGLTGIAGTPPRPALAALMPALAASPAQLTRATGMWSAFDSVGFLLGGGAGGLAIAAIGPGGVLVAAAAAVAVSAGLAAALPAVRGTSVDDPDCGGEEEGFAAALAGLRALIHAPLLRTAFALLAGLMLLEGTTDVQLVVLSIAKLRLGSGGPGLLYGVWGAGGVLGSGLILALVRRRGFGLALLVGALGFGAAVAVAGADGVALALAAMVPAGVGFSLVEAAVMGVVPRLADDAVIGRVYALSEIIYTGGAGVGALIAPLLIGGFGAAGSLAVVGCAFGGCALLAWRQCALLDAGQEQAGRVRELLRGVPFLAPLPLPRLERLVREARAIEVSAGSEIVRLNEPGEEFFVIEDGVVDVVEYGRQLRPGEGFGEIALLRDVPRTATVRAASRVRLWSISRPAFIAAVTAHGDAGHLADAIVAEHLARPVSRS